jgi:hypothetical protein
VTNSLTPSVAPVNQRVKLIRLQYVDRFLSVPGGASHFQVVAATPPFLLIPVRRSSCGLPRALWLIRLQDTGDQEILWQELSHMGYGRDNVREFVANPAAITQCGYGWPNLAIRDA